jgi:two-component system sensor histidine kinase ChvG
MTGGATLAGAVRRLRRSRIGLRVLAFNLLVLFLPVAGILYLDVYEDRLLAVQERGMVEQARLVAAAIAENPNHDDTVRFLARLGAEGDSRIRVFDSTGALIADSRRVIGAAPENEQDAPPARTGRDRALYRVGAWLVRVKRRAGDLIRRGEPVRADAAAEPDVTPEVRAALKGVYGSATRRTPGQRSMTLNSAVPIQHGSTVSGAVVVSQSTFRTLQALYTLRLRIFEVVVASIAVAALLSLLMSATIVRPLVRLRHAAASLADRRTPLSGTFSIVARHDEVGDLARALEELASRLDAHIRLLESFAADVSHEFKNPLASIRTAAEMLIAADNPADRDRFFAMLTRDVDRLERLVSGVRELARIDAQLAHEAAGDVDLGALLSEIAAAMAANGIAVTIQAAQPGRCIVRASRDRLTQVFENILDNARTFAPDGPVEVAIARAGEQCRVTITDRGPGIPPEHLERIFDRFFTYRPENPSSRREHAGLGLAIARTIVEGYGGMIKAENRPEGGARFIVELRGI